MCQSFKEWDKSVNWKNTAETWKNTAKTWKNTAVYIYIYMNATKDGKQRLTPEKQRPVLASDSAEVEDVGIVSGAGPGFGVLGPTAKHVLQPLFDRAQRQTVRDVIAPEVLDQVDRKEPGRGKRGGLTSSGVTWTSRMWWGRRNFYWRRDLKKRHFW